MLVSKPKRLFRKHNSRTAAFVSVGAATVPVDAWVAKRLEEVGGGWKEEEAGVGVRGWGEEEEGGGGVRGWKEEEEGGVGVRGWGEEEEGGGGVGGWGEEEEGGGGVGGGSVGGYFQY